MLADERDEEVAECVLVIAHFYKVEIPTDWDNCFYHIKELLLYIRQKYPYLLQNNGRRLDFALKNGGDIVRFLLEGA